MSSVGVACNHFIASNDAIADLHPQVGHDAEDTLEILALARETGRASARVLDVARRKELRE
jgi:hypothetical protein